jgi:hypothetical protein
MWYAPRIKGRDKTMETWTRATITAEAPARVVLTDRTVTQYKVQVQEGQGVHLSLFMGMHGSLVKDYSSHASGYTDTSRPHLLLHGLAYTLSRTPGSTGPFKVTIAFKLAP